MGKMNGKLPAEARLLIQDVDNLQVENNRLKDTLSEILKEDLRPEHLNSLEHFQTLLVNKDIAISLFRYELSFPADDASLQKLEKDIRVMADGINSMTAALNAFRATIDDEKKETNF
jgi:hypothetical protein